MSNQAWQITSAGALKLTDLDPLPRPGPKQCLVRVHAVSLNYRDKLVADFSPDYAIVTNAGLVPCSDGAEVVEQAGSDCFWKRGDRVIIHPNTWLQGQDARQLKMNEIAGAGEQDGTLRRYLVWNDDRLVKCPDGLSFEEASTLFTAGCTAFRALFYGPLKLQKGMTILTQGTGGVSCFAIQLAAAVGATVIATSSSDEKLQIANKLGATHTINYRTHPNFSREVMKYTKNVGVDLVVDVVGAEAIEESIKSVRFGGAVVSLGLLSKDPNLKVNVVQDILYGAKTIVGHLGAANKQIHDEFSDFVEKHDIHPEIAEITEFEKADEALFEALPKLSTPGKIVVKIP